MAKDQKGHGSNPGKGWNDAKESNYNRLLGMKNPTDKHMDRLDSLAAERDRAGVKTKPSTPTVDPALRSGAPKPSLYGDAPAAVKRRKATQNQAGVKALGNTLAKGRK